MGMLDKALSKARRAGVKVILISSPVIILTAIILVTGFVPYIFELVVERRLYMYFMLAWLGLTVLYTVVMYINLFTGIYIIVKPLIGAKNAWGYLLWSTKVLSLTTFFMNFAYFLVTVFMLGAMPWLFFIFFGVGWLVGLAVSFFAPIPVGRLTVVWAVGCGLTALGTFLDMLFLGTSFKLLFPGLYGALSLGIYVNMDVIIDKLGFLRGLAAKIT